MPGAIKKTYSEIIKSYTKHELEIISQFKRFSELCTFDKKFASLLEEHPEHAYIQERMNKIGVKLNVKDIYPNILKVEASAIVKLCRDIKIELSDYPMLENELADFPILSLWIRWKKDNIAYELSNEGVHTYVEENQHFDAWRKRRIAAAKSELGHLGNIINHIIFSFELNKGCSVGCRFCAYAAEKLSATFACTEENRVLWRDILQVCVDLFGETVKQSSCYCATEPFDNPHYLEFIQDFQEVTNGIAFTTTAAPLKDTAKFRNLLHYYRKHNKCGIIISVLSAGMAKKIHETYTPDELRDVTLKDQTQNTDYAKAIAGKMLHWDHKKMLETKKNEGGFEFIPPSSVECMSGFLVNVIDRTIKLISPCKATEKYPYGYRTYAEAVFTDASDYRKQIERIIQEKMKDNVENTMKLAFRDDLIHEAGANGFILKSLYQTHTISGDSSVQLLGTLLAEGRYTYGEIAKILREKRTNALAIPGMIKNLYDQGFIDETLI